MTAASFDPAETYLDLRDGAELRRLAVDENFWPDVIAGRIGIEGRLVSAHRFSGDWDGWERHPEGDELLCLLEGAVDVVYEVDGRERRARLDTDMRCFLVPAGAWHRFEVAGHAYVLFVTPGRGTEHKPL